MPFGNIPGLKIKLKFYGKCPNINSLVPDIDSLVSFCAVFFFVSFVFFFFLIREQTPRDHSDTRELLS